MRIDFFKFGELSYFSKLVADYTSHQLPKHLLPPYSLEIKGLEEQFSKPYPLKIDRHLLSDTILQQYGSIPLTSEVRENIHHLTSENTYTIVAAHQLSLLGGPLYYVIKIANAIALAQKLQQAYPDKKFVPVYWMGSEDHDFEEVNHIYLFGKKVVWETEQTGPVGRFSLENIEPVIQQVKEILGERAPHDILQIIDTAYSQKSVEQASRVLVHALFGKYGLLIVNGDDHTLKSASKDIILQEIQLQKSFSLLNKRSDSLKSAGYHAQATGREINLFYLQDKARTRIIPHAGGVEINGDLRSIEDISAEVHQYPERFSPNVVLRPVFQQSVLPNIAFIGGGGEIAYWMQLTTIFEHYQVRYPVLIPRTSLLFVNKGNEQKLQKLNLKVADLFVDKDLLKKNYLLSISEHSPSLAEEKEALQKILAVIKEKAATIDPTLGPAAGADAQKIQSITDQIEGKMMRAIKQKNDTVLKQIDHLYQAFFPNQSLQERHDNFLNFYMIYGSKFIDWLVQYLQVIDQEFVVMTED